MSIAAQPGSITFSEAIRTEGFETMESAKVAGRYLESLSAADYQQLKISPMCLYNLGGQTDVVRQLITEALLAPSPWHSFGSEPVKAAVNLLYELEHCQLNLKIDEARFQQGENEAIPGLLFAGDFIYSVAELSGESKINSLKTVINNWQQDADLFQSKIAANVIKTAQAAMLQKTSSSPEKVLVESA